MVGRVGFWRGLKEFREELRQFDTKKGIVISDYLDFIGDLALDFIKQNTPVESGELRDSWKIVGKGMDYIEIGTERTDLVDMLEKGVTGGALIIPRRGKALKFLDQNGEIIFRTKVVTRGMPPNRFVHDTSVRLNKEIFNALLDSYQRHVSLMRSGKKGSPSVRVKRGRGSDVVRTGTKISKRRGIGSTRSTVGLSRGTTLTVRIKRVRKVTPTNWAKDVRGR